ncbi:hypothetical protein Tco_0951304 [Tanacetum coccineum]|uniref:Uncharacterized protein n=1 Tax=Tanacetum coccineum TaxID=301880 RepID=A0ABQ5DUM4_9ASTR
MVPPHLRTNTQSTAKKEAQQSDDMSMIPSKFDPTSTTLSKILIIITPRNEHTPIVPIRPPYGTLGKKCPQGLEEPTPDEARLLYDNETGKNQRNHEELHYSESKTPTARTEPKKEHGNSTTSRRPVNRCQCLSKEFPKDKIDFLHLGPGPRKEGGVFNRLGGKERSASARSDSRHQGSHEKETEDKECPTTSRHMMGTGIRTSFKKLARAAGKDIKFENTFGKIISNKTKHIKDPVEIHHIKQRDGESTEGLYERYKAEIPGLENAGMSKDLWIHARYNPPRADQAFIRENSEVNGRNVR